MHKGKGKSSPEVKSKENKATNRRGVEDGGFEEVRGVE